MKVRSILKSQELKIMLKQNYGGTKKEYYSKFENDLAISDLFITI